MFIFLDLTFWKGPDSTGALTASTLWPTSSFLKSWNLSTPTSPSTLEKTLVCLRGKHPSIWKQQAQSSSVAPASLEAPSNRRWGKTAKGLWQLIWLWSSQLVKRQNLSSQRQPIKQHRRRQVWWNRVNHICSIKWFPHSFWSERQNEEKQCRSAVLWDIKYTNFMCSV